MGAYTISGAVAFNGIPVPKCIYTVSHSWEIIKNAFADMHDEPIVMALFDETRANTNPTQAEIKRAVMTPLHVTGGDDVQSVISDVGPSEMSCDSGFSQLSDGCMPSASSSMSHALNQLNLGDSDGSIYGVMSCADEVEAINMTVHSSTQVAYTC